MIKDLIKNKKNWLNEIAKSDERNPILYLNNYKEEEEYKTLHLLAQNKILEERENRAYSTFTITQKGLEILAKVNIRP